MRLRTKMCLWITAVLCFSLSLSGSLFISKAFSYSMEREQRQAVNQYQFVKFVLQSYMLAEGSAWKLNNQFLADILANRIDLTQNYVAVFNEVKEEMNATFPARYKYGIADNLPDGELRIEVKPHMDKYYLELSGMFHGNNDTMYLLFATDIGSVFARRTQMENIFYVTYLLSFFIGSILVYGFTSIMLHPIKRLSKSAQKIAQGNYGERVNAVKDDEVGELSRNFNKMADEIQKNVEKLELAVRQRENFVANFAHELKTPLTSVIGYSDMIYRKELTREETKEAAEYIMNEGLRLEVLSKKLMDLFVLDKQEFVLIAYRAEDLFQNIRDTITPMLKQKEIELILDIQPAYLMVEFDLWKTLMLNLLDNAGKANSSQIRILGFYSDEKYAVKIEDNGIGIPREELDRILEVFYVVDKSRSRAQHGAGIGLSLAEKIAEIHGSQLHIESEAGEGTAITFYLKMEVDET